MNSKQSLQFCADIFDTKIVTIPAIVIDTHKGWIVAYMRQDKTGSVLRVKFSPNDHNDTIPCDDIGTIHADMIADYPSIESFPLIDDDDSFVQWWNNNDDDTAKYDDDNVVIMLTGKWDGWMIALSFNVNQYPIIPQLRRVKRVE
jgi:hypothetical protein